MIAVLEADKLMIIARNIGERGQQLARILWYAALPVGVQASIDRDTHILFVAVSYHIWHSIGNKSLLRGAAAPPHVRFSQALNLIVVSPAGAWQGKNMALDCAVGGED